MLAPYAMHTHISAAVAETCGPLLKTLIGNGYQGVFSCEHHSAVHEMDRVEWQLGAIRKTIAELGDEA